MLSWQISLGCQIILGCSARLDCYIKLGLIRLSDHINLTG